MFKVSVHIDEYPNPIKYFLWTIDYQLWSI